MKKVIKNIIIVIAPLIGGFLSSLLANFKNYNIINKPIFSPPKIVFPIVWSILYLLFGISFYLANKDYENKKITSSAIINLILNYSWTFIFFKLKMYIISAIELVLIILSTIKFIIELYKENKTAAFLQLPYLVWLLVALYLNIGVIILN
jgi:hypothetical protein